MWCVDLRGKTALVTGGARGIGAACCRALTAAGAAVAVGYSGSDRGRRAGHALVAAGGPERVLYASDAPWLDPAPQLGCVLTADVPEAALPLILRDNATRLFKLKGTRCPKT